MLDTMRLGDIFHINRWTYVTVAFGARCSLSGPLSGRPARRGRGPRGVARCFVGR